MQTSSKVDAGSEKRQSTYNDRDGTNAVSFFGGPYPGGKNALLSASSRTGRSPPVTSPQAVPPLTGFAGPDGALLGISFAGPGFAPRATSFGGPGSAPRATSFGGPGSAP